jgi:RimJ/RimL family protein N-acetyltransferase
MINFVSERLAFGPLSPEHLALSSKWANDWAVSAPRGMLLRPYTVETINAWGERARSNPDIITFMMYERVTMRPIGETGFSSLDFFHRTAEFGMLIGETDCWGQGYGTEATHCMLHYGFTHLNLHNIWLRVSSANPRGLRAYQRAGFREAGRLREAQQIMGNLCDVIYMVCLATEFKSSA